MRASLPPWSLGGSRYSLGGASDHDPTRVGRPASGREAAATAACAPRQHVAAQTIRRRQRQGHCSMRTARRSRHQAAIRLPQRSGCPCPFAGVVPSVVCGPARFLQVRPARLGLGLCTATAAHTPRVSGCQWNPLTRRLCRPKTGRADERRSWPGPWHRNCRHHDHPSHWQ